MSSDIKAYHFQYAIYMVMMYKASRYEYRLICYAFIK
jgi:hypothetical protein